MLRSLVLSAIFSILCVMAPVVHAKQTQEDPSSVNMVPDRASPESRKDDKGRDLEDPLESMNRGIDAFNTTIDRFVMRPVAEAYADVVPGLVRTGVSNVIGNLNDVSTGIHNMLQWKIAEGTRDWARVLINSTVGIFGILDVASTFADLEKHEEDAGQTLGSWGVPSGPYLVLPFFGPSSLRDAAGLAADLAFFDVVGHIEPESQRNFLWVTRTVDRRADMLPADRVIDEAALDRYAYVRDAYLQARRSSVFDGNAPRVNDE